MRSMLCSPSGSTLLTAPRCSKHHSTPTRQHLATTFACITSASESSDLTWSTASGDRAADVGVVAPPRDGAEDGTAAAAAMALLCRCNSEHGVQERGCKGEARRMARSWDFNVYGGVMSWAGEGTLPCWGGSHSLQVQGLVRLMSVLECKPYLHLDAVHELVLGGRLLQPARELAPSLLIRQQLTGSSSIQGRRRGGQVRSQVKIRSKVKSEV